MRADFESDRQNKVKQRAVVNNGLERVIRDQEVVNENPNVFSIELKKLGEIHAQKQSGRCWMFSALVTLEKSIAEKMKVDAFSLSKSFLYFYDILERANSFCQHIIDTADLPLTHKKVQWVLQDTIMEGGFTYQAHALIEKYGIVPEKIMPETANSSNSGRMLFLMKEKLVADAKKLRNASENDREAMKDEMLAEIYNILAVCLGTPPEEFTYSYRSEKDDKDKDKKSDEKLVTIKTTPLEFFEKYAKIPDDFVELRFLNDYKSREWDKLYEGDLIEMMAGQKYTWANVKICADVKEAMIKQLKDDMPVDCFWDFGRQFSGEDDKEAAILDTRILRHDELFGVEFGVASEERGLYNDSYCQGHATSIVAVHLDNDKPVRWKMKNSHGKERAGDNTGWAIMNDNYLDEYCIGVVLRKKYLSPEIVAIFDQKPTLVKYWE